MIEPMSSEALKAAHRHSSRHRSEIGKSTVCGCFYCKQTFAPGEILDWCDEEAEEPTALCPKCGIDSVIGDNGVSVVADGEFLKQMHAFFFERTVRIGSNNA